MQVKTSANVHQVFPTISTEIATFVLNIVQSGTESNVYHARQATTTTPLASAAAYVFPDFTITQLWTAVFYDSWFVLFIVDIPYMW